MTKLNVQNRHHTAHPVSAVKPNLSVNQKPNYVAPERAALPNMNPSQGQVGVDAVNSRLNTIDIEDDGCDPDDSDCDEDRLAPKHN
jgi:hypothetical protein